MSVRRLLRRPFWRPRKALSRVGNRERLLLGGALSATALWGALWGELLFRAGALPVSQAHAQAAAGGGGEVSQEHVILVGIGLLQLLQSIGVVGWVKWSVEKIAADRARAEVQAHDAAIGAHIPAAEHNHRDLKDRLEALEPEIERLEAKLEAAMKDLGARLSVVSARLGALLTQHLLMHRERQAKRADDPPDFDLGKLLTLGDPGKPEGGEG